MPSAQLLLQLSDLGDADLADCLVKRDRRDGYHDVTTILLAMERQLVLVCCRLKCQRIMTRAYWKRSSTVEPRSCLSAKKSFPNNQVINTWGGIIVYRIGKLVEKGDVDLDESFSF